MITFNNDFDDWKRQIQKDTLELEKYKDSYNNKIKLYNVYLETMDIFKSENVKRNYYLSKDELKSKLEIFKIHIQEIENSLNILKILLDSCNLSNITNTEENLISTYNQNYNKIKSDYIDKSFFEEETTMRYIEGLLYDFTETLAKNQAKPLNVINNEIHEDQKIESLKDIENNNTLLISEKINKIILPYTAKEVKEILANQSSKYTTPEEVIEDLFTRPFSDFKPYFKSRYNETMKLAREREHFGIGDSIVLAAEMMKNRYLHPAIIAACRTLDELDVYLDCLDKNELDDFKIFKIKYELYPMVVKAKKSKSI